MHCGKILLKSGADPTFPNDVTPPPVINTLQMNHVSIQINQYATYYVLDLLTTADISSFDLGRSNKFS
jgi:hypothetical protein